MDGDDLQHFAPIWCSFKYGHIEYQLNDWNHSMNVPRSIDPKPPRLCESSLVLTSRTKTWLTKINSCNRVKRSPAQLTNFTSCQKDNFYRIISSCLFLNYRSCIKAVANGTGAGRDGRPAITWPEGIKGAADGTSEGFSCFHSTPPQRPSR